MTKITGGCHCGAIRFEAEGEFDKAVVCNCSHCSMKGFYLAFVPEENFTLTSGKGAYATYHFNNGVIDHNFCKTCGVEAFGFGRRPDGVMTSMINLRCVDGIDLDALEVMQYDGRAL